MNLSKIFRGELHQSLIGEWHKPLIFLLEISARNRLTTYMAKLWRKKEKRAGSQNHLEVKTPKLKFLERIQGCFSWNFKSFKNILKMSGSVITFKWFWEPALFYLSVLHPAWGLLHCTARDKQLPFSFLSKSGLSLFICKTFP